VDFFPGPQRYYSIAGGIIGTLSIVVYGQMLRRTPIPFNRIASLATVAAGGGVIGGTVVRAKAYTDFFRNLDNRPAFFQAIDNIQSRLGEKPEGQRADPYPSSDDENQEMADGVITSKGSWEDTTVDVNRATLTPNSSTSQPSQRRSRWDEIRAEHARSMATRSSWDELRQNAGRPKSENTGSDRTRGSQDPADDRLAEQQKFDAMLEAERQRAARGLDTHV